MAKFLISAFADESSKQLEGQIDALKRNGLHCIEPRAVGANVIEQTDEEIYAIAKALADNGISVPSLGSPIGKYPINEDFEIHHAAFRRALRACELLGTKRMRIFSFFTPHEQLKEYRPEVLRRLNIFLEEAERAGVTLCHENETKIYGQNPEEVADLLESLPGLRGIFDAANFLMDDQDPIKGFEATSKRLEYCHVKDVRAADHALVPVGEGDGQYEEILRRIDRSTDRTVVLTLEPHLYLFHGLNKIDKRSHKRLHVYETPEEAFDIAVNALKQVLAKIGHPVTNGEG